MEIDPGVYMANLHSIWSISRLYGRSAVNVWLVNITYVYVANLTLMYDLINTTLPASTSQSIWLGWDLLKLLKYAIA